MGAVYKCRDTKLNEIVALKVIHPRLLDSPQALARFRQEVSISRKLQHPNIVRVFNLEESEGKEYFTMEWIDGVTLREIIIKRQKEKLPFSLIEANNIIGQLADALGNAHKFTIHRDIKPENVLVTNERELKVKLSDFGIAKMLSPSQFTSTSMQMGTPYYMAPEQKVDAANIDKRADVYALGVVLFELLTLENTIGFELPSEINKSLPSTIDDVVKKAVSTKPDDRYADAEGLSGALSNVATAPKQSTGKEREEQGKRQEEEIKAREAADTDRRRTEEQKRIEEEQQRQSKPTGIKKESNREKSGMAGSTKVAIVAIVILVVVAATFSFLKKADLPQQSLPAPISLASTPATAPAPIPAYREITGVWTFIWGGHSETNFAINKRTNDYFTTGIDPDGRELEMIINRTGPNTFHGEWKAIGRPEEYKGSFDFTMGENSGTGKWIPTAGNSTSITIRQHSTPSKSPQQAVKKDKSVRTAAEEGDAQNQYRLGRMYEKRQSGAKCAAGLFRSS
jgi:serine/threonine protein kinase